jgi:hypothetical protein
MSASNDDIRVRIAGDLTDIRRSIAELRRETRAAGDEAKKSSGNWAGLGRGLTGIKSQISGIVGAYLSFRGVSSLISAVVRNTVQAEEVTAQLEARIKSTGGVAGFTGEQLVKFAKDLQDVTRFSDEAIVGAQQVLLGFQNIRGDNFTDTTEAVLNMASALRIDASSAAQTLGKALNDPVRGITQLRRQGILLTNEQQAQVKRFQEINDLASAQRVILEALEKQYGGAAAAARDTLGGALDALKNAFGELLEGKGEGSEALRASIESLTEVLKDPATVAAFQTLTSAVLAAAETLVKATRLLVEAGQGIGIFLAQAATGTTSPTDQVEALTAAIERNRDELKLAQHDLAQFQGFNQKLADQTREKIAKLEAEARSLAEAQHVLQTNPNAFFTEGVTPGRGAGEVTRPTPATIAPTIAPIDARDAIKELQSQLEAAGVLLDDELKRIRETLERDFSKNLVSFEDFFRKRTELQTRAINQEIEQRRAALSLLDEEIRLADERGDEIEDQEAKRAKLVSEITVLERERGDVATKAARDLADANEKLAEQLAGVRERLLELRGDDEGARASALEREFKDLMARLVAEGDVAGQQLVQELINVELARTRLEELQEEVDTTLADLARAQRRVELEVETGNISEREGRRRIIELHQQTAEELEKLIPLYEQLAAATGDPAAIARVEDLKLEIEELGKTSKTVFQEMKETTRDAGESAFASFLSGAQEAGDAFDSFLNDLRRKAAQLVSEKIFDKLFGALGGIGGGGGIGGFFASLFHGGGIVGEPGAPQRLVPKIAFAGAPRLHMGGIVPGERPAILQTGEEVLSRRDPRNSRNSGGGSTVNVTIETKDAESFRRESEGQIGASIATQLQRARARNGG